MMYLNWKRFLISVLSYRQRIPYKTSALTRDIQENQPKRSSRPMAIFLMSKSVAKKLKRKKKSPVIVLADGLLN